VIVALPDVLQLQIDGSIAAVNINIACYIGEEKGIQGKEKSCYMDSTIFGIFALNYEFDAIFEKGIISPVGNVLWTSIINPLRG